MFNQQQQVWVSGSHLDALHGLGGFFDKLWIVYLLRLCLQLLRLLEPRLPEGTCAAQASAPGSHTKLACSLFAFAT